MASQEVKPDTTLNFTNLFSTHLWAHKKKYTFALAAIALLALVLVSIISGMAVIGAHASWAFKFMITLNTVLSSQGSWIPPTMTALSALLSIGLLTAFGIWGVKQILNHRKQSLIDSHRKDRGIENDEIQYPQIYDLNAEEDVQIFTECEVSNGEEEQAKTKV